MAQVEASECTPAGDDNPEFGEFILLVLGVILLVVGAAWGSDRRWEIKTPKFLIILGIIHMLPAFIRLWLWVLL